MKVIREKIKVVAALALGIGVLVCLPTRTHAADLPLPEYRLRMKNGLCLEGKDGVLKADGLYAVSRTGRPLNVAAKDIAGIDRPLGNKAKSGFAMGAGIGFLTAALAYYSVRSDPDREVNPEAVLPVFAGCIFVGGGIGALIGSNSRTWQPVRIEAYLGNANNRSAGGICIRVNL